MKHKYITASLTITSFLLLLACNEVKNQEIEKSKAGRIIPSNIISVSQAVVMHDEYVKRIAPLIEKDKLATQNEEYTATQYVYMNLDSLKQYIAFLDKVQEKNKKKISGLRVYFAAYPSAQAIKKANFKSEYPGRETFFMAPTMQVASSKLSKQFNTLEQIPFYISPSGKDKYVGEYVEIEGLLCKSDVKQSKTKSTISNVKNVNKAITETSLIGNRLPTCPPPL